LRASAWAAFYFGRIYNGGKGLDECIGDHHERMMKDAVHPEGRTDFLPAQLTQADFQKLRKLMEKNQTFLVADHA
jgi:hypothetical protein